MTVSKISADGRLAVIDGKKYAYVLRKEQCDDCAFWRVTCTPLAPRCLEHVRVRGKGRWEEAE